MLKELLATGWVRGFTGEQGARFPECTYVIYGRQHHRLACVTLFLVGLRRAPRYWVTSRALYRILVAGAIVGFTISASTVTLKLAASDFLLWQKLVDDSPRIAEMVAKATILNIQKYGFLWPLFLLLLTVGLFYTFSGLNKIVDIGPHWPFVLHLDRLGDRGLERSLFLAERFVLPRLAVTNPSPLLSVISGSITLIGEVGFVCVLFLPRYRLLFIGSMVSLHVVVFLAAGINFVGSSALLLLCFDWNTLARRITVFYDDTCLFCMRTVAFLRRVDWFKRVTFEPASKYRAFDHGYALMEKHDESQVSFAGADAFEQIAAKCPLLWPFALLMKVPAAIFVARAVYALVARNRKQLGCRIEPPAAVAD